jgi:GTP diphosphokinase / guanosine-3',5'-bis(diphosphate) 3'-diphosphatase
MSDEFTIQPELQSRYNEVVTSLGLKEADPQLELLDKAFNYAAKAHIDQKRVSGDPYLVHPLEVMAILSTLHVDVVTLVGALLHDVVEDTDITVEEISLEFGSVVGLLVEGMTKLATLRYNTISNEDRQAEYFRKMLLSMAQDLRVILIKLADRLHNMRTIDAMPEKSRLRIARETLEVYSPLAHRFGIGKVKWELEDLSLKVVDEVSYRRIKERVSMKREEREEALDSFVNPLKEQLEANGIEAKVLGRAKHFYSIYNKIKKRGKSFDEILDLLAVRLVVDSISECYRTLGIVHGMFTPVLERFGDYIAVPKANLYQSLHTKVIDKKGRIVEVQIRTTDMDLVAEVGIAAHWQYKEKGEGSKSKNELNQYYGWLRQLIDGSKEEDTGEEFMKTLKINLFTDEVFVFTPGGKLIQMPKGATPVDFAFAVHTDIGLHTLGAKVDGRMVTLDYVLKNGNTVEILTSSNSKPGSNWLRFVNTHRARSKIKRYFKHAHFDESLRLGEEMFKRELSRHRKKLTNQEISDLVNQQGYESVESLFAALGDGTLSVRSVVAKYIGKDAKDLAAEKSEKYKFLRVKKKNNASVKVHGADNLMVTFGACCNPIPGDRIVGFISKGRGVMVHRNDCNNVAELSRDKDRLIEVDWDVSSEDLFNVRIRIVTEDRPHLLRDLAEVLAKLKVSVHELNLTTEGSLGIGTLVVSVKSLSQFSRLRNKISRVKGVVQVERIGIADVAEKVV